MMLGTYVVLFASALLFECNAKFVDTLSKCSIKDHECLRLLYQNSIHNIGKEGAPELDIPPIDPLRLENLTLTVLDAIKATVNDGVVKGISNCRFKSFHVDLEKQTGTQEVTCDLSIKGSVSFGGTSEVLRNLLGVSLIEGHGKGKVKLEGVYMQFIFPFYPFKKEDGEIYFKVLYKNIKYKYDIKNAVLAAEKIYLGKNEISQVIVPVFNTNWKLFMKNYGQVIIDKAMDIYFSFAKKFFEGIPAKYYIIEDLTPYVQN